jgi:hypothetical protein
VDSVSPHLEEEEEEEEMMMKNVVCHGKCHCLCEIFVKVKHNWVICNKWWIVL